MASSHSSRISSLIKELSAVEQQSNGSIYENEELRTDAAHLVRKLAVALERPHEAIGKAMKSSYSSWLLGEGVLQDTDCHLNPALVDWHMMVLHSGMMRTVGRWRMVFEKAGPKLVKNWTPPGDGDGIVEAVREGPHGDVEFVEKKESETETSVEKKKTS
ncbi:hypothetical protein TSTA_023900 [Talaromyces stipitatus ATCC 10500]|uniref:Uncharacterized protein n=1 Tax=Talaromyces stipitatus (strain ATCC 10500 / CBS 375.48 / QM 6759 / NRRL 1006) TaxID=441959 RepID=B8M657_TALSN|nr:uncharacterized protein TSTA_023900 [Talaromyces stipitatus ATCC 10500]EED19057.1 hypothetical protein TSTA_023900 [Talaromyces stipitatus ATCC 10500]